jgi:hypothetical protein
MLDERAKKRLAWEDGGRRPQTPEQIAEMFQAAGLPCHPPVARAFAAFGGGRFCLVDAIHTPIVQIDRFKTKYAILYAKDVVRALKPILKRHPGQFAGYNDPDRFRVMFADCNRAIEALTLDGHGRVYEADARLAPSLEAWLEGLARGELR